MRKIILALICLLVSKTFAQDTNEKKVKTEISDVTVFLEGAQITRKKAVELNQGETILKFTDLSPFIDAKSIQVKANGNVTILAVNQQQNFIEKLEKQQELVDLEDKLKTIEDKLVLEQTHLQIIKEELEFLKENRSIGGKNQELSVVNLREASNFYSNKLTELKIKEIERNKTLVLLITQKNDLQDQINTISGKKEFANGEILVKVETKNNASANFEISYFVRNAGWFPSYDIRAKNVNEPVELIYKANVKQDTKISWNNVKLKLSTANPNVSGVAPELRPYFLNYNTSPPSYNLKANSVEGIVLDNEGIPLPGVNVIVTGTTIGTSTDFDGKYSITIPNSESSLTFSYLGFTTQIKPVQSNIMNIFLEEDASTLDEVVVTGYGSKRDGSISKDLAGQVTGVKIRGNSSLAIPITQTENQTTVDFEIKTPYTIKSDNKSYSVDIEGYELPAFYQYYCVPKIDKDAFLIANISDWEKYNLLEGEANIFFEETYVGKTILNIKQATDTLQISLGRDKNVSVKREIVKNFTTKQFIGSKKEETKAWNILVKNNKSERINMLIFDQVPVSTLEEIKVDILKISEGKLNTETGEIKWEFSIELKESKGFDLTYTVKYPKNKNLIIE